MSIFPDEDAPVADAAPIRRRSGVLQEEARRSAAPADGLDDLRPPMRGASRGALRDDDPIERAKRRAAEILGHGDLPDDAEDQFYIDPSIIPPGWSYEWKRLTVHGKDDPTYETRLARGGWEPVSSGRHPELMPRDSRSETIERDGMILMERPMEVTKRAMERNRQRARDQVRQKEESIRGAPEGHFERHNKGDQLANIKKSYVPMEIPDE